MNLEGKDIALLSQEGSEIEDLAGGGSQWNHPRSFARLCFFTKRTAYTGGRFDETDFHEFPPFSLIHAEPVVDPNASVFPVSSISSPCRYTRSYACFCGSPFLSVSNVFPPSLVRLTTTRPSVGHRFSSF